jgi:hypothetical protein
MVREDYTGPSLRGGGGKDHCTRALEQRLRNVDLESLLFDELPEFLEVHVQGA